MAKPDSIKLKKYSLDNLKVGEKQYYRKIEGMDGFFIRVIPSGVKTWYFIYRVGGRKKYLNLGNYPAITLEAARNNYNAAYKLWEKGSDPAEIGRQEKEDNLKASTVSELVTNYIERHAKRFKRSWQEDERILNKEVIPIWGHRKAADVKKRDVLALLESIVGRRAPGAANNTFQVVRKMFNFAVEQDILPFTPCAMVKLPAPKNLRKRVLSEAEVKTLWKRLDDPDLMMSTDSRRALKLILVTGQRGGEVCGMHTREIDGKWWTIPVDRQKVPKIMESKRSPHRVYLSDLATELIGDAEVTDSETDEKMPKGFIFPSPRVTVKKGVDDHATAEAERRHFLYPSLDENGKPIVGEDGKPGILTPRVMAEKSIDDHALAVAVRRHFLFPILDENGKPVVGEDGKPKTENLWGIDEFTPHDLRRTASTFMAKLGVKDEVIDAVLNHVKHGVIKVYNQYRYDKEKQLALEIWEEKLRGIIC